LLKSLPDSRASVARPVACLMPLSIRPACNRLSLIVFAQE
jgi:hypothetical protein